MEMWIFQLLLVLRNALSCLANVKYTLCLLHAGQCGLELGDFLLFGLDSFLQLMQCGFCALPFLVHGSSKCRVLPSLLLILPLSQRPFPTLFANSSFFCTNDSSSLFILSLSCLLSSIPFVLSSSSFVRCGTLPVSSSSFFNASILCFASSSASFFFARADCSVTNALSLSFLSFSRSAACSASFAFIASFSFSRSFRNSFSVLRVARIVSMSFVLRRCS